MGYGIIRVQKVKSSAVGAMQYHNDRQQGRHTNEDIDPSRTHLNEELVPHLDYATEVEDRISRFRQSDRKVRKDAVVLVEGVATASPEFFAAKDPEEVKAFFNDVFEFVKAEAGEQNMVHFTVHMDESTPHAHFGFTPIKDGSLSWKKFFDGKFALTAFQDRFWEQVGRKWGLERGEKAAETGRKHRDTAQMKRDNQRELKALEREVEQKQEQSAALDTEVEGKQQRLEYLRQRESEQAAAIAELDREIEQAELQPAQESVSESARALWAARSDGKREEVLGSEIEGLRSRISASEGECERLRERVGELERGLPELRERHQSLGERFRAVEQRVSEAIRRLQAVPETLSKWALNIADKLGVRTYDPHSLAWQVEQARAVARRAPSEHTPGRDVNRSGWSR